MKQQDYTIIKVITTILVVIAHITRFYSMGGGAIKMEYNLGVSQSLCKPSN